MTMSEHTDKPYYEGDKPDRGCNPPPPPPKPCPDPCSEKPRWRPPDIRKGCCPEGRECCEKDPDKETCCSWFEVDDPCVRAASCGGEWTTIKCTCTSTNEKCNCDEWDCGSYPQGTCVPCKPCDGLIPDPEEPPGGGEPPNGEEPPPGNECTDELRKLLNDVKKAIADQLATKTKAEADIKAGEEQQKELEKLLKDFAAITDKYTKDHHKLVCRENCLKGFARDIAKMFEEKFDKDCLDKLRDAINQQLCLVERVRCCQKSLEGKLNKVTKVKWEQQQAEARLKKAEDGLKNLREFPKWVGDQFKPLEDLMDPIRAALHDKDPMKHRWAFYEFYWKFLPGLCKRFPIAVCCPGYGDDKPQRQSADSHAQAPDHIGCDPGDWHPTSIDVGKLTRLICCALENVQSKKKALQDATADVKTIEDNLEFIKKEVERVSKALEAEIKSHLETVECKPATTTAE